MKTIFKKTTYLIASILLLTPLGGCGYRNANVYSGDERQIYLSEWRNRTSKLAISSNLYRSLVQWYQKSSKLKTTNSQDEADLILAGEIISLYLPSLSYTDRTTSEVKVILKVRYVLYDMTTKEILFEVPSETWTESYIPNSTSSSSPEKENKALKEIVDDISRKIYQQTLRTLRKQNM